MKKLAMDDSRQAQYMAMGATQNSQSSHNSMNNTAQAYESEMKQDVSTTVFIQKMAEKLSKRNLGSFQSDQALSGTIRSGSNASIDHKKLTVK